MLRVRGYRPGQIESLTGCPLSWTRGGALSAGVQHESAMPEIGMVNKVLCSLY